MLKVRLTGHAERPVQTRELLERLKNTVGRRHVMTSSEPARRDRTGGF